MMNIQMKTTGALLEIIQGGELFKKEEFEMKVNMDVHISKIMLPIKVQVDLQMFLQVTIEEDASLVPLKKATGLDFKSIYLQENGLENANKKIITRLDASSPYPLSNNGLKRRRLSMVSIWEILTSFQPLEIYTETITKHGQLVFMAVNISIFNMEIKFEESILIHLLGHYPSQMQPS